MTNEAPDLSYIALWTSRGRVLLCLPLLYDSPVSTFVARVDGMDRSSDQAGALAAIRARDAGRMNVAANAIHLPNHHQKQKQTKKKPRI